MATNLSYQLRRSRLDLILDSAALHLANFGVGTSSLPEIAACMGLTRSALYYYAQSKEDLIFQVYRRSCDILAETAETVKSQQGSAQNKLIDFVTSLAGRPHFDVIALSEVGMLGPEQKAIVLARYEVAVTALSAILSEGAALGDLRACNAEIVARTIISIVHQLCMLRAWTQHDTRISPLGDEELNFQQLVDGTVDLLLNGWAKNRTRQIPVQLLDFSPLRLGQVGAFDREGLARAKRQEILITASRLFNQRGVSSTTLDDIAAALGSTKRTLYHHVGDKQALLSACHARARDMIKLLSDEYEHRVTAGEDYEAAHLNYLRSTALANLLPDIAPIRASVGIPELTDEDRQAHHEYVQWLLSFGKLQRERLQTQRALRDHDGKTLNQIHIGGVNWLAKGLVLIAEEKRVEVACEVVDVLRLGLKPLA